MLRNGSHDPYYGRCISRHQHRLSRMIGIGIGDIAKGVGWLDKQRGPPSHPNTKTQSVGANAKQEEATPCSQTK
jgi:hypothetical protein